MASLQQLRTTTTDGDITLVDIISRINDKPKQNGSSSREKNEQQDPREPLKDILRRLVEEHEHDQNFPDDLLNRAREYLENEHDEQQDALARLSISREFEAQKELMLDGTIYPEVRAVVDDTDDPTLPVGTFRVFLLGTIFAIVGTGVEQFFSLRMPPIGLSTFIVQILALPVGKLLAKWLPTRKFRVFLWEFTLNPGPFNQKEQILIAMMANVTFGGSAIGAYIVSIIQVLKLDVFYGEKNLSNSIPWQILALISTQFMGYGCAGLVRRFLVYPPSMIWPKALANIALAKALNKDNGHSEDTVHGWKLSRYKFFLICFTSMFFYFWIPNYLFKALYLFNWPTWISPGNVTLALIAGSTCGLGLNPLPTLDWNVATYLGDPIVTPFFTLMNFASGMAIWGFIVAPLVYFNNVWDTGYLPINNNYIYDNHGSRYNISRVLLPELTLNQTAYHEYSVPLMTSTQVIKYAAAFMIYVATPVHMYLWHRKDIMSGIRACWARKSRDEEFNDVHNRLMSAYPECPHWWYIVILVASFIIACVSVSLWPTAVLFTVVLQIPIGMLLAVTNLEVSTRILSQLIAGYVFEGRPIPNMIFKMFSFMSTHQSLNFSGDLKLAHYAKIPPRWAFAAQVYATLLAGFVALGVNHWLLRNVEDVCQAHQKDRFTCPRTHTFFMSSVIWGVVGPRRLFGTQGPYRAITYTIPIGVIFPIAVYLLSKRWPNAFWRNVNAPVLFSGPMAWAPYNWSYVQGSVVLAFVFNKVIKRRYAAWWKKYAYVLTSSMSAAIGISGAVMYFAVQHTGVKLDWWGNRVQTEGVDQRGFLAGGKVVDCSMLKVPEKGYYDIGFEWKV
ncbi:OPT oligopeptide transporter protein-domain-containing protein [Fusarium oxysporum Fo47]|uniref:OPT oligopeptide transporter protein-domain-containing protein n=1 Tax=Fusarium oxysporum Fo47 TaxID=660027 RepID=UPI001597600D|nr:OPT oligopeptide transporter protein-domain-containing protein [Fusarium oxysporum Fo47]QKD50761.1 OPT oligopeptide transporter protein-domain-containing protein [Fusarium oxysporum Fo47]